MKKIEAVVRPEKLDVIRVALEDIGCGGITITEVKGQGRQKGVEEVWRGRKYRVNLLPKLKIEVIVKEDMIDNVINTIMSEGITKSVGDGKIFISNINNAYRIRTGEEGDSALT